MGERLLCKQEVVGSIPSASTIITARSAVRIELRAARAARSFFDIVHGKRSESLDPRSVRLGRVKDWVSRPFAWRGSSPARNEPKEGEVYFARDDRKIVISLTKREIKHNKGVWRMPWH